MSNQIIYKYVSRIESINFCAVLINNKESTNKLQMK